MEENDYGYRWYDPQQQKMFQKWDEEQVSKLKDKVRNQIHSQLNLNNMAESDGYTEPKKQTGCTKPDCNCIEIAEQQNGGEPVKSYQCLKFDASEANALKQAPATPVGKMQFLDNQNQWQDCLNGSEQEWKKARFEIRYVQQAPATPVDNHYKALYLSMKSKAENLIDKIEAFDGIDTNDKEAMKIAFTELFSEQDKVQDFIDYWDEKESDTIAPATSALPKDWKEEAKDLVLFKDANNVDRINYNSGALEMLSYFETLPQQAPATPAPESRISEQQNDLWIEANRLFNTKEHTQDGRDLQMQEFVIVRKGQASATPVADWKEKVLFARQRLVAEMPVGAVKAWDLINIINKHIRLLDEILDEAEAPATPVEGFVSEVTGTDDNRPKPKQCYAEYIKQGDACVFPACHCGLPQSAQQQAHTTPVEDTRMIQVTEEMLKGNKSYIVNCYFSPRRSGNDPDVLFDDKGDGTVIAKLDGYAIIPMEQYRELKNKR